MVGLFNLGQKQQSSSDSRPGTANSTRSRHHQQAPPAYNESSYATPVVISETTTTTQVVTTTQTTTHFFSLPLWRRRVAPTPSATGSGRQSMVEPATNELGVLSQSPQFPTHATLPKVDKALPPTPSGSDEAAMFPTYSTARVESPEPLILAPESHSQPVRPLDPSASSHSLAIPGRSSPAPSRMSSEQPTLSLARAALGLGLPHVMPQQATSVTPEVAAVTHLSAPYNAIRRVKSYHRANADEIPPQVPLDKAPVALIDPDHRRSRGLSLGPWQFGVDAKGKGKAKEEEPIPAPSITRKSSFFGRRRKVSTKTAPSGDSPWHDDLNVVSGLPQIPTVFPPGPNATGAGSPTRSSYLRRHNSERRHSQQSMSMMSFIQNNSPHPSPPVTGPSGLPTFQPPLPADSTSERPTWRRPQTADSATARSRTYSMFMSQPSVASSGLPDTLPPPRPSLLSPPLDHTARRRSQTNPLWPSFPSLSTPPSKPAIASSPSPSPRASMNKPSAEVLKPQGEESPEIYIQRLTEIVSKAEMGGVLASSTDAFHVLALKTFIGRFQFHGDPLDIAIRKLLMEVGLPRETQQIDRVIEAFAYRYSECNPKLLGSNDQAYVLAFSLIMLHTDAFNKSNKRKMTKADYVKNTRLPGVPPEVLEYFFDNIVFSPFIFIEDSEDVDGSPNMVLEPSRMSSIGPPTLAMGTPSTPGGSIVMTKGPKIDPYFLIAQNLLDQFRVRTETHVKWDSPFSFFGTRGPWDEANIRRVFANASVAEIADTNDIRLTTAPFFGLPVSGVIGSPLALSAATLPSAAGALAEPTPKPRREAMLLKVTKIGTLQRKDDTAEGGKRAPSRRWREWTVILTGSQLLFFRDPTWAQTFVDRHLNSQELSPLPRPDELVTVKDAVAVYDSSYTKYPNCLRFVMANGRHIFLRASDEDDLNEWICRINYASAFRTAGVRIRPIGMSPPDIRLTGIAAAASYIKSAHQAQRNQLGTIRQWDARINNVTPFDLSTEENLSIPTSRHESSDLPPRHSLDRLLGNKPSTSTPPKVDMEAVLPPQIESGPQFKAIFDQTKLDLASRDAKRDASVISQISPRSPNEHALFSSRSSVMRTKLEDLESKFNAAQAQLDTHMTFVRNISILTPFQQVTRERLDAAIQAVSKKIIHVRLEVAKLACHRRVLEDDLVAARSEWQQTRALALRAALDAIESAASPVVDVIPASPTKHSNSEATEAEPKSTPRPIPRTPRSGMMETEHRTSSLTGSFYSAADGLDWSTAASTEDDTLPADEPFSLDPDVDEEPASALPADDPGPGFPFPSTSSPVLPRLSISGHERFYTAVEDDAQAEEWNKTQAANRVSLVKLPSDLRISALFRQSHSASEIPSLSSSPSSPRRNSRDSPRPR